MGNENLLGINFVSKLKNAKYYSSPFPHWVIKNFFSVKELEKIDKHFPSCQEIIDAVPIRKNNKLIKTQNSSYHIEFDELEDSNKDLSVLGSIANCWISQKQEVLEFLKNFDFAINLDQLIFDGNNVEVRGDFRAATPATISGTTQLGPHLDSNFEILAGLIYLRKNEDNTVGGDLDLYKLKENAPQKYASNSLRVPVRYLDKLKTIKYENNSAVFFVSHPLAIHGVTPRSVGIYERRLINFSLELDSSGSLKMYDSNKIIDDSLAPKKKKLSIYKRILRKLGFNIQLKTHKYGRYKWQKFEDL